MMASKNLHSIESKEIQYPCCHKKSRYRVTVNSAHCQIKYIHCSNQFLACSDSDCNFFFVNNKRALSFMNIHISFNKQKTSTSYIVKKPSTKEFLFNNRRLVCPLYNISFDNQTSLCRKSRVDIDCPNCNKMLISCNSW